MSIEGLLLGAVIILGALLVVALPLFNREGGPTSDEALLDKQRSRLAVVYERVLTNLRDLDEDYRTGKMPPADYEWERELWVQRGIQVLKVMDDLAASHTVTESADMEAIDRAIDQKIEAAVRQYRDRAGG